MYDIQLGDSTSNTDNDELIGSPPSNVNVELMYQLDVIGHNM